VAIDVIQMMMNDSDDDDERINDNHDHDDQNLPAEEGHPTQDPASRTFTIPVS